MRKLVIATTALMLLSSSASSQYYNYSDWDRMSEAYRVVYLAGAFDALVTYVTNEDGAKAASHYKKCVMDDRMTAIQLSRNVHAYVKAHPKLKGEKVQGGLLEYLQELCGLPPQ